MVFKGRKDRRMRLIDADALIQSMLVFYGDYSGRLCRELETIIDNEPTIAIKATAILLPTHAEWIEPTSYDGLSAGYYTCSKCRCIYGQASNYCPNCGAKMDEK